MLTLLAILCPPLAVLATGNASSVATNLRLTMLLFVPGVLHALSEVEKHTLSRRYQSVIIELERRHVA